MLTTLSCLNLLVFCIDRQHCLLARAYTNKHSCFMAFELARLRMKACVRGGLSEHAAANTLSCSCSTALQFSATLPSNTSRSTLQNPFAILLLMLAVGSHCKFVCEVPSVPSCLFFPTCPSVPYIMRDNFPLDRERKESIRRIDNLVGVRFR